VADPVGVAVPSLEELKPGSGIYRIGQALPRDVCREMVRRFEDSPEHHYRGRMGQAGEEQADIKRSTDLRISGNPAWQDIDRALFRSLGQALVLMAREFPFFSVNRFHDEGYNLQRTLPGEFYHWHVDGGPGPFSQRQLVALWYLNDVPGPGGSTDFALQDVSVVPREGDLLLFPPFWTHIHRGATLEAGVKYIATTWLCFAGPDA